MMNFPITETFSALAALAAGGVLSAHVGVKASSVVLHQSTHGQLHADRRLNRLLGEAAAIAGLANTWAAYRAVHGRHHADRSMTRIGLDAEADDLRTWGFEAGRSEAELWRTFRTTPFKPRWLAAQVAARLKANFLQGPPLRLAAAWLRWGGLGAVAAATGWLPGYLGALGVQLVAASWGAYLELTTRHLWQLAQPEDGRERQFALSHWRLPIPQVPDRWTPGSALRFGLDVLGKTLFRLAAVPGDLVAHSAHHQGWDRELRDGVPAWTDAALAHASRLRAEPLQWERVHTEPLGPLREWFPRLARERPQSPRG